MGEHDNFDSSSTGSAVHFHFVASRARISGQQCGRGCRSGGRRLLVLVHHWFLFLVRWEIRVDTPSGLATDTLQLLESETSSREQKAKLVAFKCNACVRAEGAGNKIFNRVSASWWDKRRQQKIGFSVSFSTSWSCGNKVSVQDSQSAFCHGHYHDSVFICPTSVACCSCLPCSWSL